MRRVLLATLATAALLGFALPVAHADVDRQLCAHLYQRAIHTTGLTHDRVMIRGTLAGCFILH